jgi:L-fuculose-phosphate aldolase
MLEEFQRIGRFLLQERLVDSHGGNMSVRVGDRIFITRRDAMLGDLREGDIVEVGIEAGEGEERASRELPTHRAVYKQCSAGAIVHAHPVHAIALSITDNKIVPQDSEGLYVFKSAPIVRVRDAIGSEELVRLLPSFLGRENVVAVVKGHGSFAVGKDLEEAYKFTSVLENSCRVVTVVRSAGNRSSAVRPNDERNDRRVRPTFKSAIPPGIGVMDRSRSRYHK